MTHPRWLSKEILQPPQLLHAAFIQKEAALTRTIPILFPLYFYDCHVDRGEGEVGGDKRKREAGRQVLPLRRDLTKMRWSTPSSTYLQTLKI